MSDPVELIFLNPLPFDGRFWAPVQANFGDVRSHRPTISSLGSSLVDAAHAVLELATGDRLVVVGNSVGGSCALEVAAAAPDRVEHVVLIGAKAGHRPEPDYCRWALELLESEGPAEAWDRIWRPLFSPRTPDRIIATARSAALAVPENDLAHGIRQFHGRRDLCRFAAAWPKPITAVSGLDDRAPTPETMRAMTSAAVDGRFNPVADCGHYVSLEAPDTMHSILERVLLEVETGHRGR